MGDNGSTVPRRQLGRLLKRAREEAGVALEAAAVELEWSRATMYRIEGGQSPVKARDVTAMCHLYGASAELTEALVSLARETKSKGWWHAYGDVIPAWFELYVGLESVASRLRQYEPSLVPGLLQTKEYAAAVFRATPGIAEAEVDQAVALRLERQRLLVRRRPAPPRLDVIMDEAVVRRAVEGMPGQIDRLIEAARQPRISVRLLPLATPIHQAAKAGAFVILDFPTNGVRAAEPTTIYSESLTGALYLDRPTEVRTYAAAWRTLEELALDEGKSAELLANLRETVR